MYFLFCYYYLICNHFLIIKHRNKTFFEVIFEYCFVFIFSFEFNFEKEEQLIEDTIGFIKTFRNIKQENNITKDLKVKLNNTEDYSLIKNMLKLNENIIEDKMNITEYKVNYGRFSASIYYEKEITEEDILQKEKQIETLKQNILKRENLLSNENFVNKAPEKLVNEERTKLDSDKKMLELLTK